ncbi:MAG: radical SAM protein [Phaeodactylibacter sp.]|nr:radical SAM protein [Phaeodactylibacter sp.]MCB9289779.1 radical SAM protein [Lewinellaceae bacterium]
MNEVAEPGFRKIHPKLPLFRIPFRNKAVFYTPGRILLLPEREADILEEAFRTEPHSGCYSHFHSNISALLTEAESNMKKWQEKFEKPFSPECLTIYLSNECNLRCTYCYTRAKADKDPAKGRIINPEAINAAVRKVAEYCRMEQKQFVLVMHGGGEPTYHWSVLQDAFRASREMADNAGIPFFSYIATNGIMNGKQARWLARNFDLIGLSCDGEPDIQNRCRPARNGADASDILERTASAILDEGGRFMIRATVMPQSLHRLTDSVHYFVNRLNAGDIRVEPVYGSSSNGFLAENAPDFVHYFKEALQEARRLGANLSFAGIRLNELHGAFCDITRNTLRLASTGDLVSCFMNVEGRASNLLDTNIGRYDKGSGQLVFNKGKIEKLKEKAAFLPEECRACLNIYHCSRGCPDYCPPAAGASREQEHPLNEFRCRIHQAIALHQIQEEAMKLDHLLQQRN